MAADSPVLFNCRAALKSAPGEITKISGVLQPDSQPLHDFPLHERSSSSPSLSLDSHLSQKPATSSSTSYKSYMVAERALLLDTSATSCSHASRRDSPLIVFKPMICVFPAIVNTSLWACMTRDGLIRLL